MSRFFLQSREVAGQQRVGRRGPARRVDDVAGREPPALAEEAVQVGVEVVGDDAPAVVEADPTVAMPIDRSHRYGLFDNHKAIQGLAVNPVCDWRAAHPWYC